MSFNQRIFNWIHTNNLIYNCCWEDPACDRKLLQLDENSRILMLTSAGCNALDYLNENVEQIHCVDLNFRQNAVLDLKCALFRNGDHELLWDFFGKGFKKDAGKIYTTKLAPYLHPDSKQFWDKKIHYFEGGTFRRTFYFRGASGFLAWIMTRYLNFRPGLRKEVDQLLKSHDIMEQGEIFDCIRPKLFSFPMTALMNKISVLSLAGVPKSQFQLVSSNGKVTTSAYLSECLERNFSNNPGADNYFYQVYFNGSYSKESCPEYLKPENFGRIRHQIDKITFSTESINNYLRNHDSRFSHFNLLDNMDWLVQNEPEILDEQWDLIRTKSTEGARVLFRSAAADHNFLPTSVSRYFRFNNNTSDIVINDRVGMYRYTGLAEKIS
ncbi:MAG: DUF3419 family protein [Saprospirales bacterium]|nr:MAG: DUF3419 family protein [Saprospirales bacterium]